MLKPITITLDIVLQGSEYKTENIILTKDTKHLRKIQDPPCFLDISFQDIFYGKVQDSATFLITLHSSSEILHYQAGVFWLEGKCFSKTMKRQGRGRQKQKALPFTGPMYITSEAEGDRKKETQKNRNKETD